MHLFPGCCLLIAQGVHSNHAIASQSERLVKVPCHLPGLVPAGCQVVPIESSDWHSFDSASVLLALVLLHLEVHQQSRHRLFRH